MSEHPAPRLSDTPTLRETASDIRRPPRLPWSEQDLEALQRLCDDGLDDAEIASRLGRTQRAVRTMILRVGGKRLRDPFRPWSEAELETITRMHAAGEICAVIAEALPGRTAVAVFRKLCRLVGPAPSTEAKRSWRAAKRARKSANPVTTLQPVDIQIRFTPPRPAALRAPLTPAPRAPLTPVAATLDDMVRWLRSRDFIVLRKGEGWRIDHHPAMDDEALVAFVNLRRTRLHLAPFSLKEARIMPAAIASQVVRGRRWGRPQFHAGAARQA